MPGFELINNDEKKALLRLFDKKYYGKRPLFRPRIYVKKFEQAFSKYMIQNTLVAFPQEPQQ